MNHSSSLQPCLLEIRRRDFNAQCWEILQRMLAGEKLTMLTAVQTGIGDIRRRAKDLIDDHQIPVCRKWAIVEGVKQRHKCYYIDPDDIEIVANRITEMEFATKGMA